MNYAEARTIYVRQLAHMRETYGLELLRGSDACPRKVLPRQRCRRWYSHSALQTCLCDEVRGLGLHDHARLWRDRVGGKVWSTEPYDVTPEKIAELRALLAPEGLDVDPRPYSPYAPGHTTLILVRAPRRAA